jgi:hypothetical protein
MSAAHRFEPYLAGSIMLLLGLLLITFLLGLTALTLLPALFLIGLGVIFLVMALLKSRAPVPFEMPSKATLAYGVIMLVVGVLWTSLYVQATLVGYILALVLVFFGLVFLAYTKIRPTST